jgi:methionyl-tRNA formyltransferase
MIFFGTPEFSTIILDELEKTGVIPTLVVTGEDKPVGRKLVITPPKVKMWAQKRNIPVLQAKTLRDARVEDTIRTHAGAKSVFVVASYGKIIPKNILDISTYGSLNVHPSLLPKLRGPSPIESAILTENETGVTIMLLDEEMDHGPLLAQEKTTVEEWPPYANELEITLAHQGGSLLARVLPGWIAGTVHEVPQEHDKATYCKKITKADGLINLSDTPELNMRKVRAFCGWPHAYMMYPYNGKNIRVIITRATIEHGEFVPQMVIPEGKKEMSFEDFKRGIRN